MSDDQGYADLGCYGSAHVKTPHLDQMAREGMLFTQAYAGSPVCAPARCVLMTGKHSGHITRRDNRTTFDSDKPFRQRKLIPLHDEDYTVAEMLKESGYVTGAFGKWGLGNPGTTGPPYKQGFDEFYGYIDQVHAHNYYTDFLMHNEDTVYIPENTGDQQRVYSHDLIAAKALQFIRDNQDKSFFLYLPFTLPHGRYEIQDNSEYGDQPWDTQVKNYAAMITYLDKSIGELFSLLKDLGLDEETIVFFTSDNGPNPPFIRPLASNKPFRGVKRQLLEGGIRVPMIVRWPGQIRAGVRSNFVWAFWDVFPTLRQLAGFQGNPTVDGISILPTLLGKPQKEHEFLYWEFYSPFQQAVRIGDWKGIRLGLDEPIHLFDLKSDPGETVNLASDHPEVINQLKTVMENEHDPDPHWPAPQEASEQAQKMLRLN